MPLREPLECWMCRLVADARVVGRHSFAGEKAKLVFGSRASKS